MDGEIKESLGKLAALGNSSDLENGNLEGFYQQASAVSDLPDVWTLLLDADGQQVLNTIVPFGTRLPPPVARERVQKVMATQRPLITDLIIGPVTGKLLTTIYVPTKPMHGQKYVVAQAFAVEHWKKTALQPQDQSTLVVGVIDSKGRFIARSKRNDLLLGKMARPELVEAAARSIDGVIRHKTLEGVDSYDAFTHSKLTGWTIAVAAPVEFIETSATHGALVLSIGVATAMAVAVVAALAFARRFITSVEASTEAARSIEKGIVPSVPSSPLRELNVLNESLMHAGAVLAAERRSREALEAERLRLLENESAARQEAQAQNAAKDKFLALLGHELRNPLAAITGATEVLRRVSQDPAMLDRYLEMIRRQNRHLTHIVNDLLDVSRMLSGKIVLETTVLNLAHCVPTCVEAFRVSHKDSQHRLTVHVQDVFINGDPTRIDQILNNLLTNAFKFSGPDDGVRVEVRPEGDNALITVTDWGVGIEAGMLTRIFEPFVQGPTTPGRVHSGLGIGLALVKQLVHLHGGNVMVRSDGLGAGSTFSVSLPRVAPQGKSSAPRLDETSTHCHVLLIEDNLDAMAATSEMLRLLGYEVQEACSGEEAVLAVSQRKPDVIVMDIGLPGKDGHQVAAELKALAQGRSIPLIALTGYGQQRGADAAQGPGQFDDYLTKPVEAQELQDAIERQLRLKAR